MSDIENIYVIYFNDNCWWDYDLFWLKCLVNELKSINL